MTQESSKYINELRREYSMYVLQSRALPATTDGLKPSGRRALWTARDGKKYKTATLAGAMMEIHPHAEASDAINTITGPYKNNIPLFEGDGAFGTLLNPTAYGAARYTSVSVSTFTKDVIFADIEIIPMMESYDGHHMEPVHFLPLVPIVLVNPTEGIAVGFATSILPRNLLDILQVQVAYLKGTKTRNELIPHFGPTDNDAYLYEDNVAYFEGSFERLNSLNVKVTKLPYGISHEKYLAHLLKTMEKEDSIVDYEDHSKDYVDIRIKFKRNVLSVLNDADVLHVLNLKSKQSENLTVINFDHESVLKTDAVDLVNKFTEWRLSFYPKRYERLAQIAERDIQRYKDLLLAIRYNLGSVAKKTESRSQLKEFCEEIGIVHVDYIVDLPVYRFTKEEAEKTRGKMETRQNDLKGYIALLNSIDECKKVYINELLEIQRKFKKGDYTER